jgi:3'(2'), 5'-bisphosphate nucleotidase
MAYELERDEAIRLATEAAVLALEVYERDFTPEQKADRTPVTEADKVLNEFLVGALQGLFPNDLVVGEESGHTTSVDADRSWFVDPIDGTSDFIKKNGEWSVMIGMAVKGRAVLGVVCEPAFDRLYFATEGGGAFERTADGDVRLRVNQEPEAAKATIVNSRSHPDPRISKVRDALSIGQEYAHGSVGCKLAQIAEGRADMYFNFSGKCFMWDTCGPEVIIREAGGDLVDFEGERIHYGGESPALTSPFIAVSDVWQERVLAVTRSIADELDPSRHP